ncbi:MAG: hypothetical protein IKY86_02525 [Clostridia bacterium]|nr:hypothetical protein [Clostridia bacterium]
MKKLLKYPFLCLLVLSMVIGAPFIWQQIGLLPEISLWQEAAAELPQVVEPPQLDAPEQPVQPDESETPDLPVQEATPSADDPMQPPAKPDKPFVKPGAVIDREQPQEVMPPEKPENPFAGALFIGDSRTVGIGKYAGIKDADFFASTGMSVYSLFTKKVDMTDRKGVLLEDLLTERKYDRIYLMLGINELGYNFDRTVETYGQVVDTLRALQPQAYIHIQANLHVTKEKSSTDKLFTNANIDRLNQALAQLADDRAVFYMDVNPAFDDEEGNLGADLTWDGVHLLSKHYKLWADWLLENTPA